MSMDISLDGLLTRAKEAFVRTYDRPPSHAAAAPGRVNLIGEHTDYNDGFVLPCALEHKTLLLAAAREDREVRLHSSLFDAPARFELPAEAGLLKPGEPTWANYIKGVLAGFLERGIDPGGFDAVVQSAVPLGGGLSSSAALEVATATLVEALADTTLDPVDKALLCQKAEHDFAGMPCGIMDQFISVMGKAGHALLIDCRSRQTRDVAVDPSQVAALVINSNVKHELVGGEYAERRAQCEAAAKAMHVAKLRDADLPALEAHRAAMGEPAYRRAHHVITENQRTLDAAEAMSRGDYKKTGELMNASHAAMRDDFEITVPQIDKLVEIAQSRIGAEGVYGSRMTGGGFGGCTVTLIRPDAVEAVGAGIAAEYEAATGIKPTWFATTPGDGAMRVAV